MADNTTLNAGSGGDVIASDDIGGIKHQRVKVQWGADGAASDTADTATAALPIKIRTQHTVTDLTTTPLANGANYTTQAFNTEENGFGFTFIFTADQSASLELIESHDNVTYITSDIAPYPGGSYVFNEMHVAHAKYFKIRVTNNSGSAMTSMVLQCIQRTDGMPWKIKLDENGNAVTQGGDAPWAVEGTHGNNNEVPNGFMFPTVSALVQSSVPTYTSGFMAAPTLTTSGDLRVTLDSESVAVTGTFWQATQPVSGTFWQATQPVSIASMPTTPVTGTFWQATQPVSIATLPALAAGTANIGDVDVASLVGGATIATNQVTVGAASTLIVAQRTGRRAVLITNHGTVDVYVGITGLTTGNGFLLKGIAGATVSIPTAAAVYGITGSSQAVSFMEVF